MLKDIFAGWWKGYVAAAWSAALILMILGCIPDGESNQATQQSALNNILASLNADSVIAAFTVVIAIVGALTYFTFNRQADLMDKQIKLGWLVYREETGSTRTTYFCRELHAPLKRFKPHPDPEYNITY